MVCKPFAAKGLVAKGLKQQISRNTIFNRIMWHYLDVLTNYQRVNHFLISKNIHGNRRLLFLNFVNIFPASGEVNTFPLKILRLFLQYFINFLGIFVFRFMAITDIWTKFGTEHKYHTLNTPEWPNSHKLKIQDGSGRHLEFRKNVNNFGWKKISCIRLYEKMHHDNAEMTTWLKVEAEF